MPPLFYPKSARDRIALEGWHGMTHLQKRHAGIGMPARGMSAQRHHATLMSLSSAADAEIVPFAETLL